MREMFDICFADYRPTIYLQQFKYKTFFLKVPEITFCNNTSNLNLTSRHLKKEKKKVLICCILKGLRGLCCD